MTLSRLGDNHRNLKKMTGAVLAVFYGRVAIYPLSWAKFCVAPSFCEVADPSRKMSNGKCPSRGSLLYLNIHVQ